MVDDVFARWQLHATRSLRVLSFAWKFVFRSVEWVSGYGCKVSQDFDFHGLLSEVCFVSVLSRRACSICYYFGRNVVLWHFSRKREKITLQTFAINDTYTGVVVSFNCDIFHYLVQICCCKKLYQNRYYISIIILSLMLINAHIWINNFYITIYKIAIVSSMQSNLYRDKTDSFLLLLTNHSFCISLLSKILVSSIFSRNTYLINESNLVRRGSWISYYNFNFNNNLECVAFYYRNGKASRGKFVRNLTQNSRRASNQSPFSCCCTAVTCRAYARYYASMWSPSVHRTFPRHCTRHVRPREAGLIKRAPSRRRRSMAPAYLNPAFIQRRY